MRIIGRETWGALAGARIDRRAWPTDPLVVVHHTAGAAPAVEADPGAEAALVRGLDRQHFYGNGWAGGIGYSFVILPSGRVYEGRGRDTVGAHSPGANHLPGVALVGDFRRERPSGEALAALGSLAYWLGAVGLRGHRDYYATECPGAVLYGLLGAIPIVEVVPPALPGDRTLRLMVRGHDGAPWAGWDAASGPLRWIAARGLDPVEPGAPDHWISWQGGRWYGAKDVTNVARRLVRDYLTETGS